MMSLCRRSKTRYKDAVLVAVKPDPVGICIAPERNGVRRRWVFAQIRYGLCVGTFHAVSKMTRLSAGRGCEFNAPPARCFAPPLSLAGGAGHSSSGRPMTRQ